jgi:hypothetical protein
MSTSSSFPQTNPTSFPRPAPAPPTSTPTTLKQKIRRVILVIGLIGLVAAAAVSGYFIYKSITKPKPPNVEVFGVEFTDFVNQYDADVQVEGDGTITYKSTPLDINRLSEYLPTNYTIATKSQLTDAAMRGMQQCAWGIGQNETSQIVGMYPMQVQQEKDGTGSCVNDTIPDQLYYPRLIIVGSVPVGSYPNVLWVYGPKPTKDKTFYLKNDDPKGKGRKIYPWYGPVPGDKNPEVWSYYLGDNPTPVSPSFCSQSTDPCIWPLGVQLNGTQKFLCSSNNSFLTLDNYHLGWAFTPEGYMYFNSLGTGLGSELNAGVIGVCSVPTVGENYPVAVWVAGTKVSDIVPNTNPTQPNGASTFTLNENGTIILKDRPTWGLGYNSTNIIITQDKTKWFSFSRQLYNN